MTAFKFGDKVRVTIDATVHGTYDAGGRTIYDLLFGDQVITLDPDVDPVEMTHEKAGQPEFYKVPDVMTRLNVSNMTVRRLIETGEMHAIRVGRSIRIPVESFEVWLRDAHEAGAK